MKKISFILLATLTVTLFFSKSASAMNNHKPMDRVVAVVSGSVITQHDLENRFQLIKRQLQKNISKNQLKAIYKKTLGDLINEEVQNQYAKEQDIAVKDSEIDLAIAEIEKRNNLTHGAFYSLAEGLVDTAKARIAASLIRQKIVDKKLRPRVVVSKGEVDRLIMSLNNGKNNWQKEVYQIFMAHPKDSDDKEVEQRISNLYKKLKTEDNDNFFSYAKTLSEDPSAKEGKGGYIGWFGAGELSPSLDEALSNLKKGEISPPISTTNGWHLLYVSDLKATEKFSSDPITECKLFKYQVNLNNVDDKRALKKSFKNDVKKMELLGDIEEATLRHVDNSAYKGSGDLGWVPLKYLDPKTRKKIANMDINDFSDIIQDGDMLEVYHMSDKRDVLPQKLQNYRNRLQGRIMQNRLELAAKRFIRDLRRQAYVEIRL